MMTHHDNDNDGGVVMAFGYYNNPGFMTTTVSSSHTSPNHSLRYRMSRTTSTSTTTTTTRCHSQQSDDDDNNNNIKNNNRNRRSVLQQLTFTTTTFSTAVVTALLPSIPARAVTNYNNNNKLFQSNTLLTNPILEQLRIWEQEEADNIKYNGELERGDAGNQGKISAYPSLLIPILAISQDISYLYQLLVVVHYQEEEDHDDRRRRTTPPPHPVWSYRTALNVLTLNQTNAYDTIPFKRTFNAYADNVYYSDPDRANMYLGGGGT